MCEECSYLLVTANLKMVHAHAYVTHYAIMAGEKEPLYACAVVWIIHFFPR